MISEFTIVPIAPAPVVQLITEEEKKLLDLLADIAATIIVNPQQ